MSEQPLPIQPELPPHLLEDAIAFARGATWTWSTTMHDHWYCIVMKESPRDARVDALLKLIKQHGTKHHYHGTPYKSVTFDGWDHWITWPALNKRPSVVGGWDGQPACPVSEWLTDEYRRDLPGTVRGEDVAGWATESDHLGVDLDDEVQP